MRIRTLTATLLAMLGWIALPGVAQAGSASEGGGDGTSLVWSRFVDLDFSAARIVIGDSDGDDVTELTHSSDGVTDIDPQLSPDGRLVAFERDYPDGSADIVVVGSDGRGERVLDLGCDDPCALDVAPSWTPDGRHLIFTRVIGPFNQVGDSATSAVLWRTDLAGADVVRVSEPGIDGAFEDYHASFAPAGYMVFIRVRNGDIGPTVFRMNADGTGVRQLTPWSLAADLPFVSPASGGPSQDLVVFEAAPPGSTGLVATVPADCRPLASCARQVRNLTSPLLPSTDPFTRANFNPAWSPDGSHVVYVNYRFVGPTDSVRGDIWTMRWDGADKQALSTSPLFEFRPYWGVAA